MIEGAMGVAWLIVIICCCHSHSHSHSRRNRVYGQLCNFLCIFLHFCILFAALANCYANKCWIQPPTLLTDKQNKLPDFQTRVLLLVLVPDQVKLCLLSSAQAWLTPCNAHEKLRELNTYLDIYASMFLLNYWYKLYYGLKHKGNTRNVYGEDSINKQAS